MWWRSVVVVLVDLGMTSIEIGGCERRERRSEDLFKMGCGRQYTRKQKEELKGVVVVVVYPLLLNP